MSKANTQDHDQDAQENQVILYEDLLSNSPNNPDILHALGLTYAQMKQFLKSIDYFKKAIKISPNTALFHNNLGNAYKQVREFKLAKTHYFEALRLKSPYPEAHNNLGGLYYQQGEILEATLQFEKSLRMQPFQFYTRKNLANCYLQSNRLPEAVVHFKKVLEEVPNDLSVLHNLAMCLSILKQFEEAYPLLKKALKEDPDNTQVLYQLAVIEFSKGELDSAKAYYLRLLAINAEHSDACHNLATLYLHQKDKEQSICYYRKAFSLNPSNLTAKHMIDALSGLATPQGAPPEYVSALFDQYAYNYNQHMVEQLKYQVPFLLREALKPLPNKLLTILDLGCGTGLCAPYFIDIAESLTGVDLSKNMLAQALTQGGYQKLIESEIQCYLDAHKNKSQFDLIISADVFVYFGCLESVFRGCYEILTENGLLIFSIETIEPAQEAASYEVRSSGRYAHQLKFIEKLACSLGFKITYQKKTILRQENGQPVWGVIFTLLK